MSIFNSTNSSELIIYNIVQFVNYSTSRSSMWAGSSSRSASSSFSSLSCVLNLSRLHLSTQWMPTNFFTFSTPRRARSSVYTRLSDFQFLSEEADVHERENIRVAMRERAGALLDESRQLHQLQTSNFLLRTISHITLFG